MLLSFQLSILDPLKEAFAMSESKVETLKYDKDAAKASMEQQYSTYGRQGHAGTQRDHNSTQNGRANPDLEAMNKACADYQNAKNERVEYEGHLQPALYDANVFKSNNLTTKE